MYQDGTALNYFIVATCALVIAVVGVRFRHGWVAGFGFLFFCAFAAMATVSVAGTWALANLFPNSM